MHHSALPMPCDADRPLWSGQLTLLDQPVQHRSGFKNGCDACRVIASALFKEMSERRNTSSAPEPSVPRIAPLTPVILAGVVTGVYNGADLYRTFLQ